MKNIQYWNPRAASRQPDPLIRTLNITTADQEVMQVEEEYAKFEATEDEDEDEYELEMDDDNDEVEDIAVQQEYEPDVSQSQFELELNSQEDEQLTELRARTRSVWLTNHLNQNSNWMKT